MSEEFKILSARDHCRERIGMYLGSASIEEVERFIMGEWKKVSYIPAVVKMVDEIIDNSIDEAIRTSFKHANRISVKLDGNKISVEDNGRGIPQDAVKDVDGNTTLRPIAAWTKTNAGTSFTDDRTTIGANGVGSACTNFCSSMFVGETWSNGNLLQVKCKNGAESIQDSHKQKDGSGTKVTFVPDFKLFPISNLDDIHLEDIIKDRLASLQIAFPEVTFKFNGRKISSNNIKHYAKLFNEEGTTISSQSENTSFFITSSEDGFRTTSYINGVNTRMGGSYVDYMMNEIISELSVLVKRKHKIEVAKSTFKSGLTFVLFARNFVNPKYDSQTKERLTSNTSEVKAHYDGEEFIKIAKKIFSSEDIIGPIIEAQLAKKLASDKRAATLAQKKLRKVKVAKHIAATRDDARLLLTEGDSAVGFCLKVRDPKKIGCLPLRGVVPNTWDMQRPDVLKNKELSEIIAVLGLDINDPESVDNMSYKEIGILTDADHDGAGHISPLLMAFFYKFWPRLFEEKKLSVVRTPILISKKGNKDVKWFYDYKSASDFKHNSEGYYHRYIKGLASHTEEEYSRIVNDSHLDYIEVDDPHLFEMMFGKDSQLRKDWLN